MLYSQKYTNFKVFLIGDTYDNNNEFEKICNSYKGEIYYENSPINYRSGYFNIKRNKWTCGGMNANLIGIKKAIEEGFDYYFHLDDDDNWTPEHMSSCIDIINKYPEVDFMISKSRFEEKMVLPREYKRIVDTNYNNIKIKSCNSVHSSWLINLNTMGDFLIKLFEDRIKIINQIKNKEIEEVDLSEFDSFQLNEFRKLQRKGKIKCICNTLITCWKKTEGNIPE